MLFFCLVRLAWLGLVWFGAPSDVPMVVYIHTVYRSARRKRQTLPEPQVTSGNGDEAMKCFVGLGSFWSPSIQY